MVMDANGMSHKPAGTVGGGQFENKVGAGADDDLDAPAPSRSEKGVYEVVTHGSHIGLYLNDPKTREYIEGHLQSDGIAIVCPPDESGGRELVSWLTSPATDDEYRRQGVSPRFNPSHIMDEWMERGVCAFPLVETDGRAQGFIFMATDGRRTTPMEKVKWLIPRRNTDPYCQAFATPYAALDERTRETVAAQVDRQTRVADYLTSGLFALPGADKAIKQYAEQLGGVRIPLPQSIDGKAFKRFCNREFKDANGEWMAYDFGRDGTACPALAAWVKASGQATYGLRNSWRDKDWSPAKAIEHRVGLTPEFHDKAIVFRGPWLPEGPTKPTTFSIFKPSKPLE